MALRVAVARLQTKAIGVVGPSVLRINNSFARLKHFNGESPLAKHATKKTGKLRVIANGVAIGMVVGVAYTYFSVKERKLPGAIVNTPTRVPVLKTLPPELKVTRKVCRRLRLIRVGRLRVNRVHGFCRCDTTTMGSPILFCSNIRRARSVAKYVRFSITSRYRTISSK